MKRFLLASFCALALACSSSDGLQSSSENGGGGGGAAPSPTSSSSGGQAGGGQGGGAPSDCATTLDADALHLAVGATVPSGGDVTTCVRWTVPEDIDVSSLVGTLGPAGHHALLLMRPAPTEADGVGPCSESEIMDAQVKGDFELLAGVSYESSGVTYAFPSVPVQVGLHVPKGAQLVFDGHFLNTTGADVATCSTIDLARGAPVIARLEFHTVLPKEEYDLAIPAHGTKEVTYLDAAPGKYRVAAASSHMHAGGTHFRMSIHETGKVLYETSIWNDPQPALFDVEKIVVEAGQSFQLDCSFENDGPVEQRFPDQMCVGGMYLLPCTLPGAC